MATTYEDQFFTVDPGNPPKKGVNLNFQKAEFTDKDGDGYIETGTGDTWNGKTISEVWNGDTLTVNVTGVGNVTYTGVTFYFSDGSPPVFTPTDGKILQDGKFVSSTYVTKATQTKVAEFGPPCFTPGTQIETPSGPRPVEDLRVGDLVMTMDHGPQPIRRIADNTFRAVHAFAPIRFKSGAIGNDGALTVSPQHRMLISGWQAELFFGQAEVLVPAKHLVNDDTIRQIPGGTVRYIHLIFDQHQIIWGQGVLSESYYPESAMRAAEQDVQSEFFSLFPELSNTDVSEIALARPVANKREGKVLAVGLALSAMS